MLCTVEDDLRIRVPKHFVYVSLELFSGIKFSSPYRMMPVLLACVLWDELLHKYF
jgi:hypothetical protein